jgi:hypothetical protein
MKYAQENPFRGTVSRALALIAFIVVLAIGVFGSLLLASAIPTMFSGMASTMTALFNPNSSDAVVDTEDSQNNEAGDQDSSENPGEDRVPQSLTVSAPNEVAPTQTFTLSWGHTNKSTEGVYAIRYDCAENVAFQIDGTEIPCDTPYTVGNTTSVALTTDSQAPQAASVAFTVDFLSREENQEVVSGGTTMRVTAASNSNNNTTGNDTTGTPNVTTPPPTTQESDPNGYTDLTVRVVAIGVVNRTTNTFFPNISPSRSSYTDRIAVRFEVKNQGTKTSPQWFFSANLPTTHSGVFNSVAQQALRPNESIIYTLAFDGFVNSSQGVVSISVDPSQYILESNENNNFTSYTITTSP